jgi:hypothetical protein
MSVTPTDRLYDILEKLKQSSISVFINDNLVTDSETLNAYISTASLEWNTVHNSLRLGCEKEVKVEVHPEDNIDFATLLDDSSEKPCQEAMEGKAVTLQAIDSSDGKTGKFFTVPRNMSVNGVYCKNYYPLTGKIDLISAICPQAIEIKAKLLLKKGVTRSLQHDLGSSSSTSSSSSSAAASSEGKFTTEQINNICVSTLCQCLDRIFCLRSTAAQLAHAVFYSITSAHAWMLVFCREYDAGVLHECVKMYRIPHCDVLSHWSSINELTARSPRWFLTPDGNSINRTLLHMGLHPATCVTQVAKPSIGGNTRVYCVSLPVKVQYISVREQNPVSCLAATARRFDFCLKISRDDGHEAYILSHFVSAYNTKFPQRQFYALGTVDTADDVAGASVAGAVEAVSADLKGHLGSVCNFPSLGGQPQLICESVWNYYGISSRTSAPDCASPISIVMRVGTLISEYNDAWKNGVAETLLVMHKAGVCHADLRSSNTLWFGDHCQLIDFNLAIDTGDTVELKEGGRFNGRGNRLQMYEVGDVVQWQEADDYEMFLEMVFDKLS